MPVSPSPQSRYRKACVIGFSRVSPRKMLNGSSFSLMKATVLATATALWTVMR